MNHILTSQSITILGDDFVPKTMPSDHPAFERVVEALKANDNETIAQLMDLPMAIVDFMQGEVSITDRALYFRGRPLDTALTRRILQFMDEGQADLAKPLIAFLNKVMDNPSRRSVQGLYEWCERSGLPITPEGDILAWKIVRADYRDMHSGTFDNSVGQVLEVERYEVDEDPDRTCSYGLHFCSTTYLPHFGGYNPDNHVMIVKINPADVVAFPRDYNTSKGRTCRYEVLGEIPAEKAKDFFPYVVSNYTGEDFVDLADELDFEIEVDGQYLTRDGRLVVISDDDEDPKYPFNGTIGDEEGYCWTLGGRYTLGGDDHPLDIVTEYDADVEPQPEPEVKAKGLFSWLFSR